MKTSTARRLISLNRDFYDRFATDFAATREALPAGVRRAVATAASGRSLLDVGCGDGRIGRALARGVIAGRVTRYRGVDLSRGLLARFEAQDPAPPAGYRCMEADISRPDWRRHPGLGKRPFDGALCLATLFHLPGPRRRLRLLREVRERLAPDGVAVVSVWQFRHVPRLCRKIVPWREIGLRAHDVDRDDLLLDWRRGGRGLRYVHHFAPDELTALCRRAGFEVIDSYASDGVTGDMSLFVVLHPGCR